MNVMADPGTGLDWVTLTEGADDETCEGLRCSAQATHAGYFRGPSWCPHSRTLYCLRHGDQVLRQASVPGARFVCAFCEPRAIKIFLRMEALR